MAQCPGRPSPIPGRADLQVRPKTTGNARVGANVLESLHLLGDSTRDYVSLFRSISIGLYERVRNDFMAARMLLSRHAGRDAMRDDDGSSVALDIQTARVKSQGVRPGCTPA